MEQENFKQLNAEQLKEKVDTFRRELFSLRLTVATAHVKDNSQFRKFRKNIARALTQLTFLKNEKSNN